MRNQEWLENIVDVRQQVKVEQWQVGVQLHELNESPERQGGDPGLEHNDGVTEEESSQHPVNILCELLEEVHDIIYYIKGLEMATYFRNQTSWGSQCWRVPASFPHNGHQCHTHCPL